MTGMMFKRYESNGFFVFRLKIYHFLKVFLTETWRRAKRLAGLILLFTFFWISLILVSGLVGIVCLFLCFSFGYIQSRNESWMHLNLFLNIFCCIFSEKRSNDQKSEQIMKFIEHQFYGIYLNLIGVKFHKHFLNSFMLNFFWRYRELYGLTALSSSLLRKCSFVYKTVTPTNLSIHNLEFVWKVR